MMDHPLRDFQPPVTEEEACDGLYKAIAYLQPIQHSNEHVLKLNEALNFIKLRKLSPLKMENMEIGTHLHDREQLHDSDRVQYDDAEDCESKSFYDSLVYDDDLSDNIEKPKTHNGTCGKRKAIMKLSVPKGLLHTKKGIHTDTFIAKGTCYGPCSREIINNITDKDLKHHELAGTTVQEIEILTSDDQSDSKWMAHIRFTKDPALQTVHILEHADELYIKVLDNLEENLDLLYLEKSSNSKRRSLGDTKEYHCEQCGKRLKNASSYSYHKKTHDTENRLQCPLCEKKFVLPQNLKLHMNIHSTTKPYECTYCNKTFTQLGNLKSHQRIHTKQKPYHCEICNKYFAHHSTLYTHKVKHSGIKDYMCVSCGKRFYRQDALSVHMKLHQDDKNYKCEVCHKEFKQPGYLRVHMQSHKTDLTHICYTCGMVCKSAQILKRHIEGIHLHTSKKYPCNQCDKLFSRASHARRHAERIHHKVDDTQIQYTEVPSITDVSINQ